MRPESVADVLGDVWWPNPSTHKSREFDKYVEGVVRGPTRHLDHVAQTFNMF
jgi:hypothetical protein